MPPRAFHGMATVLVVDDDTHIREVARFALAKAGYAVELAANGLLAEERLARGKVDLVVLSFTVTDSKGNTWTAINDYVSDDNTRFVTIFYAKNAITGSNHSMWLWIALRWSFSSRFKRCCYPLASKPRFIAIAASPPSS